MKYWLIVYLFDVQGTFLAKDIFEATDLKQCEEFAGEYAKTTINTQNMAQFHCISDDEYRSQLGDDK